MNPKAKKGLIIAGIAVDEKQHFLYNSYTMPKLNSKSALYL